MRRVLAPSIGILACGVLLSCASSPPMRYYTLNVIAASAPVPSAGTAAPVRVEPVAIPPELDRLELVSQLGPNRVHVADSERWAAPLEDQIRRVISDDLAARLPAHAVADPNEPATNDPRRLLSIAISQFDTDDNCAVTLRAAWTLHSVDVSVQSGREQIQVSGGSGCPGAMPAAMSAALGMLSDRLAATLGAMPSSPPGPT